MLLSLSLVCDSTDLDDRRLRFSSPHRTCLHRASLQPFARPDGLTLTTCQALDETVSLRSHISPLLHL